MDRAWVGLLGGPYPAELAGEPLLRLTYSLIEEIIEKKLSPELTPDLEAVMRPALARLAWSGGPAVTLGAACSGAQNLLLGAATAGQPDSVSQIPVLERCARGVAATLLWLAEDPKRTIKIDRGGGLRINTLRGEALEILSADDLPQEPGESRRIRRILHVDAASATSNPLTVELSWGFCCEAAGNSLASVLALDEAASWDSPRTVELTMEIRRARLQPMWSGSAQASAGENPVAGPLRQGRETFTLNPLPTLQSR
jgi:hypothetical protein